MKIDRMNSGRRMLLQVLVVIVVIACLQQTETTALDFAGEVKSEVLDNGLTVLVRENPAFDIVAVAAVSPVGSLNDPEGYEGLTYVTQKSMLKGTETRTASEIAMEIESAGIRLDALVSYDFSLLYLQTTSAVLEDGLNLFSDLWQNATFPEAEVKREIEYARREIQTLKDEPSDDAVYTFLELYYGEHPYGQPLYGTLQGLDDIDAGYLQEWQNYIYRPGEMTLAVVGNVEADEVLDLLNSSLGQWQPTEELTLEPNHPVFDPPKEAKSTRVERDTRAAWMVLGFEAPGLDSEESAASRVLNSALGGGMDSRLFAEIRDRRGLAYVVTSQYFGFYGPSTLISFMGTHPGQIDEARDAVMAEFNKLAENPLDEDELMDARTYVRGMYLMENETNMAQARNLAIYEVLGMGFDWIDEFPRIIDKVAAEDIQKVAEKYFRYPVEATVLPNR